MVEDGRFAATGETVTGLVVDQDADSGIEERLDEQAVEVTLSPGCSVHQHRRGVRPWRGRSDERGGQRHTTCVEGDFFLVVPEDLLRSSSSRILPSSPRTWVSRRWRRRPGARGDQDIGSPKHASGIRRAVPVRPASRTSRNGLRTRWKVVLMSGPVPDAVRPGKANIARRTGRAPGQHAAVGPPPEQVEILALQLGELGDRELDHGAGKQGRLAPLDCPGRSVADRRRTAAVSRVMIRSIAAWARPGSSTLRVGNHMSAAAILQKRCRPRDGSRQAR